MPVPGEAPLPRRRDLRRSGRRSRRGAVRLAAVVAVVTATAGAGLAMLRGGDDGVLVTGLAKAAGTGEARPGGWPTSSAATVSGVPVTAPGGPGAGSPTGIAAKSAGPGGSAGGQAAGRTVTTKPAIGVRAAAQDLTDVAYAGGSPAQRLDLHLPRRTGTAVPLVVYVHGGAFVEGDKGEAAAQVDTLVAHGFAVASVNYRLSGEALFPAGVQDVKAAVRWLRAAAPRYGVDPARFGAWGDSAGGYLVTMLGVTGDQRTVFDNGGLGHTGTSSAVQAVVDWYGPTDFLAMDTQARQGRCPQPQVHDDAGSPESVWLGAPIQTVAAKARTSNPLTYVAAARRLPPFLVVHGDSDCNVPPGQSQALVTALRRRSATVTFTLLQGVGHGGGPFADEQLTAAVAFLQRTLHPGR